MKVAIRTFVMATYLTLTLIALAPAAEAGPGDFEHFVIGEELTATWCQFCPTAAEQLADIYYNDSYEFYFVALITDVNDKAENRTGDYPTFTGYPTVEFDGGYRERTGEQSDKSQYEQDIEDCGARADTPVSLLINMSYLGDSELHIQVGLRWDEDGTVINPTQQVYLRVYITEIISRYINHDGNPYHFGFLDYAFDEGIDLEPRTWWTGTTTWVGADHEDANGDDFGDIDYENIALIVGVFNDESGQDEYNLMSGGTIAPHMDISSPEDNSSQSGDFALDVDTHARMEAGDPTDVSKVEYSIDGGEWHALSHEGGERWSATVGTGSLESGWHDLAVRSTDDKGTANEHALRFNLSADDAQAPDIAVTSPPDGGTVEGDVTVEAEVTDESAIAWVRFRIDDGGWMEMGDDGQGAYSAGWDSTDVLDGDHTVEVAAEDEHGNAAQTSVDVEVDNLRISISSPDDGSTAENMVEVSAEIHANAEVASAGFRADDGEWAEMEIGDEMCTAEWNSRTVDNGWHEIEVRVEDASGNVETDLVSINVSNTAEDSTPPSLVIDTPSEGETLAGTCDVVATASDENGIDRVEMSVDGGEWLSMTRGDGDEFTYAWNTRENENGDHGLQFRAYDTSDNGATASINVSIENEEDADAPILEAVSPADGAMLPLGDGLAVAAHAEDDTELDMVECSFDGGPWRRMTYDDEMSSEAGRDIYSFSFTDGHPEFEDAGDGGHTVDIRASDGAGNVATASISFSSDDTPPSVSIDAPSDGSFVTGTVDVEADVSDATAGIAYILMAADGSEPLNGTASSWQWDTAGTDDGEVTISVTAVDGAGNANSDSIVVTVDNTPPVLTIGSPRDGSAHAGTVAMEVDLVEENLKSISYSVDGGQARDLAKDGDAWTASFDGSKVPDGEHTIMVTASDRAGHETRASVDIDLDNTPPSVSEVSWSPAEPETGETITFEAEVEDPSGIDGVMLWYEICQGDTCLAADEVEMELSGGSYAAQTSFDIHGTVSFKVIPEDALGNGPAMAEAYADGFEVKAAEEPPPPDDIDIPTAVLLTSVAEGDTLTGSVVLSGAAYAASTVEVSIDGGPAMVVSTRANGFDERAPYFILGTIDDGTVSLAALEGRVVVLDFMFVNCHGCGEIAWELADVARTFGSAIAIVTIDVELSESAEDLAGFRDAHGATWPHAFDTNGLADRFDVAGYPTLVFVTPDGYVSGRTTGVLTAEQIGVQIGIAASERAWSLPIDTSILENGVHTVTVRTSSGEEETFTVVVENHGAATGDGDDDDDDGMTRYIIVGAVVGIVTLAGIAVAFRGRRGGPVEIDGGDVVIVAEVIPAETAHQCPSCSGSLTLIEQYGAWYCYACREYRQP